MRTFMTTAAILTALAMPAFAEGEPTGTEAYGEPNGSFKMSAQDPNQDLRFVGSGYSAMAQGWILPATLNSNPRMSPESLKSPTGADGGNRK
jgi:hypothetical protein